jgi:hypothetical protein
MLMFKQKLTQFVATLSAERLDQLDRALAYAVDLRKALK